MAIKQTINEYEFTQAFKELRPDNFSYAGLRSLYEFFEDLSEDAGEDIELDVIAICCDFTEASMSEIIEDYGLFDKDIENIDDLLEYLNDETIAFRVEHANFEDDTIIYQAF